MGYRSITCTTVYRPKDRSVENTFPSNVLVPSLRINDFTPVVVPRGPTKIKRIPEKDCQKNPIPTILDAIVPTFHGMINDMITSEMEYLLPLIKQDKRTLVMIAKVE